jgi:hypothetical protein
MKSKPTKTTVAGKAFTVWADYIARGMYAEDEHGNVKRIYGSGYLSNDLTVRKAIASSFGLPTFRK